jgi:hypothetical protein
MCVPVVFAMVVGGTGEQKPFPLALEDLLPVGGDAGLPGTRHGLRSLDAWGFNGLPLR